MSNTRHKGIHWRAQRGVYQVTAQWQGQLLWGTTDTLPDAIALRDHFERKLAKRRTERRILPSAVGFCTTTSGPRHRRRDVVQAYIAPKAGKRINTTISLRANSFALAYSKAAQWRRKMEAEHYYALQA